MILNFFGLGLCGRKGAGSALISVRQCNGNVCRRREFPALLRPFDEADAVGRKQFVQTGIFPFLGHGKAVEVEMVEVNVSSG